MGSWAASGPVARRTGFSGPIETCRSLGYFRIQNMWHLGMWISVAEGIWQKLGNTAIN